MAGGGRAATIAAMPAFNDGLAETELTATATAETDVLIVGSGPAGGTAALCLSTLGIPNIMITKYRWTANTPRALLAPLCILKPPGFWSAVDLKPPGFWSAIELKPPWFW